MIRHIINITRCFGWLFQYIFPSLHAFDFVRSDHQTRAQNYRNNIHKIEIKKRNKCLMMSKLLIQNLFVFHGITIMAKKKLALIAMLLANKRHNFSGILESLELFHINSVGSKITFSEFSDTRFIYTNTSRGCNTAR